MGIAVKVKSGKWGRNASGASQDYLDGALNPRRSPTAAAIASKDVMLQGFTESVNSGKWDKKLQASGDAAYSDGIRDKGRARYQGGVTTPRAVAKMEAHLQKVSSALGGVTLDVRGPKGTNYGNVQKVGDALRAAFK